MSIAKGMMEAFGSHAGPHESKGEDAAGGHTELHPHGDGGYHTVIDGKKTEHPSLGHALAHIAGHHEPEGKHSQVHHHEDGTHTSHHAAGEDVQGPHDHENLEALKEHMGRFLDEESGEYGDDKHHEDEGLM